MLFYAIRSLIDEERDIEEDSDVVDSRNGNGSGQSENTEVADKKLAQKVRIRNKGCSPRGLVRAQFIYGRRIFNSNYKV